jgi:Putative peptidoglycan binding domain
MRRVPNPRFALSLAAIAFLLLGVAGPGAKSASAQSTTSSTTHKKKKSTHHRSHREPFQKAPTPDRISEIQSALSHAGYYQGDTNGKWDGNTVSALEKFQSANNLNPSGKLDATSLQKLGLGSSTAGLNAPTAPQRPAAGATPAGNSTTTPGKTQSTSAVNSASNANPSQPR